MNSHPRIVSPIKPALAAFMICLSVAGSRCLANAPNNAITPDIQQITTEQSAEAIAGARRVLHDLGVVKSVRDMANYFTNSSAGYYGWLAASDMNKLTGSVARLLSPGPSENSVQAISGVLGIVGKLDINITVRKDDSGGIAVYDGDGGIVELKRTSANAALLNEYADFVDKYHLLHGGYEPVQTEDIPSPIKEDGRRFLTGLDGFLARFARAYPKLCTVTIANAQPRDSEAFTFTALTPERVEIDTNNHGFPSALDKVWAVLEDGKWRIDLGAPQEILAQLHQAEAMRDAQPVYPRVYAAPAEPAAPDDPFANWKVSIL